MSDNRKTEKQGSDTREGFGDDSGTRVGRSDAGKPRTGAGAEAAEGLRSTSGNPGDATSTSDVEADRPGSEPLTRESEHKGSYGGEGGEPRTPSHEREPQRPR